MNLKNNQTESKLDESINLNDIPFTTPSSDYKLYHNPVQESYRQSEIDAQLSFWKELYKRFCQQYCGTSNIKVHYVSYKHNPGCQKNGIDRIIYFPNGHCLHMEEKYVNGDHDKMFVEVFDNSDKRNNCLGWFYTLNPLYTNYIVYGYELTKKFYFIPLKAFQEVFSPITVAHSS